jgi:hypothetical protein
MLKSYGDCVWQVSGNSTFTVENGDEEKLIADYAERILPEVRRSK